MPDPPQNIPEVFSKAFIRRRVCTVIREALSSKDIYLLRDKGQKMDMQGGNSPAQAMDRHRKTLGKQGEDIASAWLAAEGMRILHRNYRCRTGEIDIIGSIGGVLAFIEVRSRSSDRWGLPSESVNDRKKQKLQKLASYYLYQKGKTELPYRFDVVSILFSQDGGVERLDWIQNAF